MFILLILPLAFGLVNQEFLQHAGEEIERGASWHYVGKQRVDPKAKSLPLQMMFNGKPVGDPYIIWKLKK